MSDAVGGMQQYLTRQCAEDYMLDHHQVVETTAEKIIIFMGSCHNVLLVEPKMHHNVQQNAPRMLIQ
jgi:hypothetical protein